MPKHITQDHTINEMTVHQIQTVTFTSSQVINVYDETIYNGARFVGQINDGTDYERILFEIGHDSTDVGYDETRILIKGSQIGMSFAMSMADGQVKLTITMTGGNLYTLKYYVIPSEL